MNWHRLVVMVGIGCVLGCESGRSLQAAGDDLGGGAIAQASAKPFTGAGPSGVGAGTSGPIAAASLNTTDITPRIPPNSHVTTRIRASVNGQAILDDEIRDACYPLLVRTLDLPEPERSERQKDIFAHQLQQIVEREIILSEALSKLEKRPQILDKLKEAAHKEFEKQLKSMRKNNPKIKSDEELKNALQAQGMSLDGYKRQVERNFMMMEYMRSRIFPILEQEVGHEEVVEYYRDHASEFQRPERVQWQDLFVSVNKYPDSATARKFAEQLVARAQAGEDWARLSSQYDDGDSVYRKGEGAGQKRGEIRPVEVEPVLLRMQESQIALVEIANGFHVIRLLKHEPAGQVPFDMKTQTAIRKKLQDEIADREFKKILADLKSKAQVKVELDTP